MFSSQKTSTCSGVAGRIGPVLFACIGAVSIFAQTPARTAPSKKAASAFVTFVDNGTTLAGGLPGQASQAFRGKLYVEDELLAQMQPAHFITFAFEPVTVEFTAQTWLATGPHGGSHLQLDLIAGKHYFIELRTRQSWPLGKMFGIKEITCQQAQKEHEHDTPLGTSHVKSNGDPAVLTEPSFPNCS